MIISKSYNIILSPQEFADMHQYWDEQGRGSIEGFFNGCSFDGCVHGVTISTSFEKVKDKIADLYDKAVRYAADEFSMCPKCKSITFDPCALKCVECDGFMEWMGVDEPEEDCS